MLRIGRSKKSQTIVPPNWPARRGRARVLVENPDGAELWARSETLVEAGYDVLTCFGPSTVSGIVCPLVSEGRCAAVEAADAVISTTSLDDDGAVVAELRRQHLTGVIVEGVNPDAPPIEKRLLLAVVEDALPEVQASHGHRYCGQ